MICRGFFPSNLLKQVILISLRFFTAEFNVSKQNGSSFLFSIYKLTVDSVHIHFVKLCLVYLFRVNIKSLFYFAVLKIYFQCYFHVLTRKSSQIHAKYIFGQVHWCFFSSMITIIKSKSHTVQLFTFKLVKLKTKWII